MITNEDVTKLKEVFATKRESDDLKTTVDGLVEKVGDLSTEVAELTEKVDAVDVKLDKITGMLQDHRQEDAAGAAHLARHDRQIAALAAHTGALIPD
ncbi:hypothetical protein KGO04_03600 [Patescibacteria group bacterium]|nr:hypothetical protein [Patescibacteria group bacterium]MDE1944323.1 hypothetical protein [Patescibacteria group bacterium]MDE1945578.1 hypothetical protein [Patescibacteria group bacterium]